jgi:hypothetical protein
MQRPVKSVSNLFLNDLAIALVFCVKWWMVVNDELQRMWKEVAVSHLKIQLSQALITASSVITPHIPGFIAEVLELRPTSELRHQDSQLLECCRTSKNSVEQLQGV